MKLLSFLRPKKTTQQIHPMLSQSVLSVLDERKKQILKYNFDPKHDDLYQDHELENAAICYLNAVIFHNHPNIMEPPYHWPWHKSWWKPKSKRENLVRAIALGIAALERMDRELREVGMK